MTRVRAPHR